VPALFSIAWLQGAWLEQGRFGFRANLSATLARIDELFERYG
jgi:hypothetical protein